MDKMYDELVKRLRDAAKMSEALAVLLPHGGGDATAKLYNEAADSIEELTTECRRLRESTNTASCACDTGDRRTSYYEAKEEKT